MSMTPDIHNGPSFNLPAPRSLLSMNPPAPPRDNQNALGKVHDWLQDRLVGERAPDAYNGLLSSDEIRNARPGLLGAIAGESWVRNLDHLVNVQHEADMTQDQHRIVQSRQNMAGLFTPAPNETEDDRNSRFNAMYDYALRNSDFELAKHLEPMVRTIDRQFAEPTYAPKPFKLPNGTVQWVKPGDPIPTGAIPYHAPSAGNRSVGVAPAPIRTVETQVKEAIDQLRHATSIKPPSLLATDEEKAAYGRVQQGIPAMKQRVDSLTTVRDNMAALQQGHEKVTAPVKPPTPPPSQNKDTVKSQDEYDHLRTALHWSDAKIAQTYHISPLIKRVR